MHVTARIFLLRMVDKVVRIALQRAIAARRVRIEPTARVHREVGCLLHRFDGEIPRRLDDHCPLATDPGNNGGPGFVAVGPAPLAALAAATPPAPPSLLPAPPGRVPLSRRT